jgi:quercetin dioxygenase-like cupin family protein
LPRLLKTVIMIVKFREKISTTLAPSEYFTGIASINLLVKNDGIPCSAASVTFEPGARNHWHTHPVGQILIVTAGKGYVQKRNEPIQLIQPGDTVVISAGEEHWHGATPDSIFTHIAIQLLSPEGQEIIWLEPVSDAEYGNF